MIVTRMTFEYPNTPRSNANLSGVGARKLFNRVAGAKTTKATREMVVEKMSLAELLYFALVDQNAIA